MDGGHTRARRAFLSYVAVLATRTMRRRRRWRCSFGFAAATSLLLVGACASATAQAAFPQALPRVETLQGLDVRVPAGWSARRLPEACGGFSGPGILIGNIPTKTFRRPAEPPNACTTAWDLSHAPREFVLVDLDRSSGPPRPLGKAPPKTQFPPTLETMSLAKQACSCIPRFTILWVGRAAYDLRVWIGTEASATDKKALLATLASIHPKR
jgi:hypothetical protein